MKQRNEPVERYRAGHSFDDFPIAGRWIFDELVANKVGQKELVGARTGQIVVEVVLRRKDVVHNANEAPVLLSLLLLLRAQES